MRLIPIHVYLEGEYLALYCRRVVACHQRRRYAESLLNYNFCIDNMPTDMIGKCPQHVMDRIVDNAINTKDLVEVKEGLEDEEQRVEGYSIPALRKETNYDYARAMNSIICY